MRVLVALRQVSGSRSERTFADASMHTSLHASFRSCAMDAGSIRVSIDVKRYFVKLWFLGQFV